MLRHAGVYPGVAHCPFFCCYAALSGNSTSVVLSHASFVRTMSSDLPHT